MAILEVSNLQKVYTTRFGGNRVVALSNVNFTVEKGEYVAIMGESGSGKTTLLNILAALDKPTSGDVLLEGQSLASLKDRQLSSFRRDNLGFVFQEFNLLDTFSIEDNIYLPLVLAGQSYSEMNGRRNIPTRSPAARNSGLLWPGRSLQNPRSSWRMSPPERWIPEPPMNCCGCSPRSIKMGRPS